MAANPIISQHSSNPLEVPSSDPQNARYRRQYLKAQKMRGEAATSDDPLNGYQVTEVQEYQKHIAQLFQKPMPSIVREQAQEEEDNLYSSDDDLIVTDNDDDDVCMGDTVDDNEDDETDEEKTILLKPRDEREEIEDEIADLEEAVPQLTQDYKVVDRLGTGTFSSVYKAVDLGYHTKWYNGVWMGNHPPSSSAHYQSVPKPPGTKAMVAIKRIYVTSNPERIRNEIAIMEDCRGCRHVSQLITAFRQRDQVVAIMPYHRNDDFRDFFRTVTMDGVKAYFRCLLRALRDIHARGIIHRDVKPANFLFDPRTNQGTLCDFGLACRVDSNLHGHCLHTGPSRDFPHGRLRPSQTFDVNHIKTMQREARQRSMWPSDRVGYPEKDLRPHSKANRAGTRGFRAPEVLFKCSEQTGAIDVWAAGTILLFFLTGKFPLFQSNDDMEALMEIATIVGKRRLEKAATLHNRTFATNVPSVAQDGVTWREFVERQNPHIAHSLGQPPSRSPLSSSSSELIIGDGDETPKTQAGEGLGSSHESPDAAHSTHARDVDVAFDLLEQLLHPESTKRITARNALYHPFLAELDAEDDEFFPHPLGEGACGHLHFCDEVTEEHRITGVGKDGKEVRTLSSGEGVAIGHNPCEYHTHIAQM